MESHYDQFECFKDGQFKPRPQPTEVGTLSLFNGGRNNVHTDIQNGLEQTTFSWAGPDSSLTESLYKRFFSILSHLPENQRSDSLLQFIALKLQSG